MTVMLLSTSDAAEQLGVSARQVQNLVRGGALRQVGRGLVEESSVERYLRVRAGCRTRPWAESTAWGAVDLLSGGGAAWLGQTQRSRLRARLRGLDATTVTGLARARASVTRWRAHGSARAHLEGVLVRATNEPAALGLTASTAIDGYLAAAAADGVVARHGLLRDELGDVTLRATTMSLDVVHDLSGRGIVLAALDLAESLDARERRAGLDSLERALADLHG